MVTLAKLPVENDLRSISFPEWIALSILKKEYHPRKPSAEEDDYWK
jgi:hypothetical protein